MLDSVVHGSFCTHGEPRSLNKMGGRNVQGQYIRAYSYKTVCMIGSIQNYASTISQMLVHNLPIYQQTIPERKEVA